MAKSWVENKLWLGYLKYLKFKLLGCSNMKKLLVHIIHSLVITLSIDSMQIDFNAIFTLESKDVS